MLSYISLFHHAVRKGKKVRRKQEVRRKKRNSPSCCGLNWGSACALSWCWYSPRNRKLPSTQKTCSRPSSVGTLLTHMARSSAMRWSAYESPLPSSAAQRRSCNLKKTQRFSKTPRWFLYTAELLRKNTFTSVYSSRRRQQTEFPTEITRGSSGDAIAQLYTVGMMVITGISPIFVCVVSDALVVSLFTPYLCKFPRKHSFINPAM